MVWSPAGRGWAREGACSPAEGACSSLAPPPEGYIGARGAGRPGHDPAAAAAAPAEGGGCGGGPGAPRPRRRLPSAGGCRGNAAPGAQGRAGGGSGRGEGGGASPVPPVCAAGSVGTRRRHQQRAVGGQWGCEVASSCAAPGARTLRGCPGGFPGALVLPGDPPDLCPVSPSCPGDIPPSCPSVSPPRSHLPPASSQSPCPTPVLSPRASRPVPVPPHIRDRPPPQRTWPCHQDNHVPPGLCPTEKTGQKVPRGLAPWDMGQSATVLLGKPLFGGAGAVTAPPLPPAPWRFLSVGGKQERSRHPEQKWLSWPCWRGRGHVRWPGSRSPPRPPPETSPSALGCPTSPPRHWGDMGAQRDWQQLSLW